MRILIVDDDPGEQDAYLRCFAGTDFAVACHPHDSQAIEAVSWALAEDAPFAVAFVDVAGGGAETARRLRAIDRDLNLVVVTAERGFSSAGIAEPVDKLFHIAKPFAPEEIRQTARALRERWAVDRELIAARAQLRTQVLLLEERRRELTEAEARAIHSATHDSLTGAPNRRAFLAALEDRVKRPGAFATAMLDLDRFKLVNDTLGHLAGDAMICEVAAILKAVAPPGALVARLGGDEFGLLFETSGTDAAVAACARVVAGCAVSIAVLGSTVQGGASAGVVVLEGGGDDAIEVIRRADLALNEAKRRGRGGVQPFDAGMDESLRVRRRVERDLGEAIARGELSLTYQPIVERDGLTIDGFEALPRWDSGEQGIVDPALWLPIAEDTNLIHALGDWMFAEALAATARWPGQYVSVNVSPRQFRRHDFADHVAACLSGAGVAAPRLQIEITERAVLDDPERAADTLRRLRAMGCRVALDGFGTGQSSLATVRALPLDTLKIAPSFVDGIGRERGSAAIVHSIVNLGRALGLEVVAEGVGSAAQVQALRIAGASHLQGGYFGRLVDRETASAMSGAEKGSGGPWALTEAVRG